MSNDFFGVGLSYPLEFTPQGRLKLTSGDRIVEQALQSIAETIAGERAMLPDYGARVGEFELLDMGRLKEKFKRCVADYESRVEEIVDIDVQQGFSVGEASVSIRYRLADDANERVLTYPIFVGP
jgi:phage baseplate assembly protein W